MTVRPLTSADLDLYRRVRLAALLDAPTAFCSTHAGESAFTDAQWLARLTRMDAGETCGLVAIDEDGNPCGLAGGVTDDAGEATVLWLVSMWVAPAARRFGVGSLLAAAVEGWGRAKGLREIRLHVTDGNAPAERLYARLGYARTGNRLPYPNDPSVGEVEMARRL